MKSFLSRLFQTLTQLPAPLRILSFILILGLFWVPIALPIQLLIKDQNLVSLITMPVLYVIFLVLLQLWGRWGHPEESYLLQRYGMRRPKAWIYEWLGGLGIGYGVVLLLYELQGGMGWIRWFNPNRPMPWLLLEGFAIAALIGLAEEILFRGWLLDELKRNYQPNTALVATSVIFALLHGLRLVPASVQWISLALLSWALGMAKRVTGDRLGLSAGLHAGLVWCYYVLNVGQMFQYTNKVPVWLTGFEKNPLAGLVGILTMLGLAIGITFARQRQRLKSLH
ncbi:CPBP family intramembrane metalloprotease [filamentous cyanobacterium LEGE 11480]|uniref:CPBP family intramembrane metalloprotease n=1 Tax=Romeriopsis navalis LEGE 11480 TaxID=2777977 RepID=A0A928VTD5_9CYAN|nr:type II CAAX endopeptidase family protein [Romeriopsis navalis]MBE9033368.1 CPBP family intramembrane metalloprotease [Romeriopsis navalis LEGE 11480]